MKIRLDTRPGAYREDMRQIDQAISLGAKVAVRKAIGQAHTRGLADIAAAGLGARWVSSFKMRFYENNGIDAAGIVYSGINYGVVFERGATIQGNPTLWVPLPTTPKKLGGKRMTAKRFNQEVGRLFKIRIGGKDYLAAKVNMPKKQRGKVMSRSATMLKRKPGKTTVTGLVLMFVAVDRTKISKRLHIGAITEAAANQLPEFYAQAVQAD